MKKNPFIFVAMPLLAMLLSLGSELALADSQHVDPKGLISFTVPAGWTDELRAKDRHFSREGLPEDPNILSVVPEQRDEYMTLERTREGRSAVHAAQDHKQVQSKTYRINGFEVWEAVYEAEIRGQLVVMHDYMLFSDTLMVDVHLNASKDVYRDYQPDVLAVVESVREIDDK